MGEMKGTAVGWKRDALSPATLPLEASWGGVGLGVGWGSRGRIGGYGQDGVTGGRGRVGG